MWIDAYLQSKYSRLTMTNRTPTTYAIVGEFAGAPVSLDTHDRWTWYDADTFDGMCEQSSPKLFATFAAAEQRARRLMDGGTSATAIRIIGQ
jgi:hypothetical protein